MRPDSFRTTAPRSLVGRWVLFVPFVAMVGGSMVGRSRVLVVGVVLACVVAGFGSGAGEPLASAAVRQAAPACSSTSLPVWSPDGKQIAFVGRRLGHGPLSVRAICVAGA